MIRVNLLVDRERTKPKATIQAGQKVAFASSLVLVVAAVFVGWSYQSIQRQSADLDRQIADAERETVRLRSVLQQVQQFEQRRSQLQQRVTLIEQLRKGQTGPVHLLDHVSRQLPDTMWLLELRQMGSEVVFDGRCSSLTVLSDFVAGLESSGLFERQVEIVDSQVLAATAAAPELIRFAVRARLKPAG